jgi:hypothetical protein
MASMPVRNLDEFNSLLVALAVLKRCDPLKVSERGSRVALSRRSEDATPRKG